MRLNKIFRYTQNDNLLYKKPPISRRAAFHINHSEIENPISEIN